jgi:hypothetical protein
VNKIPTIFERDWLGDRSRVLDIPVEGCEWVFEGEGVATRKYDGTCVMFDGEAWWARREVKNGKLPPPGFVVAETDLGTGKIMGWEPLAQSPFAKFAREAIDRPKEQVLVAGTYELCGPKVQGNPEGYSGHLLILHSDAQVIHDLSPVFGAIESALHFYHYEGFVWHHPDGRMAKIKARDFGIKR